MATSTLREVTCQGRLLTLLNRREISARRGLIVSGPWATGKSTALKQLGRTYELMARQRHPGSERGSAVADQVLTIMPLVWVMTGIVARRDIKVKVNYPPSSESRTSG